MSNDVGPEGLRIFTNLLDRGTIRIKNWQFRVERAERYVILHGDRKGPPRLLHGDRKGPPRLPPPPSPLLYYVGAATP